MRNELRHSQRWFGSSALLLLVRGWWPLTVSPWCVQLKTLSSSKSLDSPLERLDVAPCDTLTVWRLTTHIWVVPHR